VADYQLQSSKFNKQIKITQAGSIAPVDGHKLYGEKVIRLQVKNVLGSSRVDVEGKLQGSKDWDPIGTAVGIETTDIDTSKVDIIRFNVSSYNPLPGLIPELVVSGFFSEPVRINTTEALLTKNNDILLEMLCMMEKMFDSQKELQLHINKITDEELHEDI
jgi:hypothetical protein